MEQYIYEANKENTARFVLGTEGKNPLIVMSINPSVGSPTVDSPTLGTVRHIAEDYNYDSWIILSLYPQRATHIRFLDEMANVAWEDENYKVIKQVLSKFPDHKIWAAWGTHIHDRYFFPNCLEKIAAIASEYNDSWMSYGPLTEHGDPHYCLYLEDGEGFEYFDVQSYLEKLNVY